MLIVDPWQSSVCFIRSGVTQCTLLMVLYLDEMCQCGLQAVLWSHIGTLIHRLAAAPRSTTPLFFPSRCSTGTPRSCCPRIRWCGAGGFQEQGQCFFISLSCSIPTVVFYSFPFLFFLSIGWCCGPGVFGLIRCISLSLRFALPTFFNNSNIRIWG